MTLKADRAAFRTTPSISYFAPNVFLEKMHFLRSSSSLSIILPFCKSKVYFSFSSSSLRDAISSPETSRPATSHSVSSEGRQILASAKAEKSFSAFLILLSLFFCPSSPVFIMIFCFELQQQRQKKSTSSVMASRQIHLQDNFPPRSRSFFPALSLFSFFAAVTSLKIEELFLSFLALSEDDALSPTSLICM